MKALIKEGGEKTRSLIHVNTLQDVRDRAAKAEAIIAALYSRNSAPVSPGF